MNESTEQFFLSSQSYYDAALIAISQARKEVLFESFIFDWDNVGLDFLEALQKAQQNGATIFLSLDRIGSWSSITQITAWAKKHSIQLHIFNSRLIQINKRNHRKLILVDHSLLFLGSLNISRSHLDWRDYGVSCVLSSSEYQKVRRHFFAARSHWLPLRELLSLNRLSSRSKRQRSHDFNSRFLFNDALRSRLFLARLLIRSIKNAQKRIWISSPYFLPRSFLLRSLVKAAKKGLDIRIIIPEKSDVWFVKLATRSLLRKLNRRNIKIYSYQKSVWHAKALLVDSSLFLGSHNWNHRSFLHDLEIILYSKQDDLIHSFEKSYELDLTLSKQLSLEDLQKEPFYSKLLGHLIYLFRYWL